MEQIIDVLIMINTNVSSISLDMSEKSSIEIGIVNGYLSWFIVEICLFVAIVFGNVLTILAIVLTRRLRNIVSNYFVFNLAVSDLLVGMLLLYHMVFYVNNELNRVKLMCLLRFVLLSVACGGSIYNVIVIAVDRYLAIVHPLRYNAYATKRHVLIMIIIVWISTISISSIPMFWNQFDPSLPSSTSCEVETVLSRYYTAAILLPLFCLNWLIMFLLYWKIWREAHICARRMNLSTVSCATEKNNRKSIQMVLTILGCFTICWFPYFIAACMRSFGWTSKPAIIWYKCTFVLAIANSAMNPLIYAWKNSNFRRAFQNILRFKTPNNKIHSSLKIYFAQQHELQIKQREAKENNRRVSRSGSLCENLSDCQHNHAIESTTL